MLQVGSGNGDTTVGISGKPAWLYTGRARSWRSDRAADGSTRPGAVDDATGGNATVGTIDATG